MARDLALEFEAQAGGRPRELGATNVLRRLWGAELWNPINAARTIGDWNNALQLSPPQIYPLGHRLLIAGMLQREVFLLTKGIVALYYSSPTCETLITLAYPGHLVHNCRHYADIPGVFSCVAMTRCEVHQLNINQHRDGNHRVAKLFEESLQLELERRAATLARMLSLRPADRLDRQLIELADVLAYGLHPQRLRLKVPIKDYDLATLVGVSIRQFNRIKKELGETGRIRLEGRTILLGDPSHFFFPQGQRVTAGACHLS
jgi:CRP/FNR family cyclic AMP-dependent transcriptional regulator